MKIAALIPARGGSKGVPGKNRKIIDGKPLISYSIETAIESGSFCRIIVSSDEDAILEIAKQYPEVTLHKRETGLASDTSPVIDTVIQVTENTDLDAVMLLQPTAPIRSPENIHEAISIFEKKQYAGSVVSVVEMTDIHPARMYWKADEELQPILKEFETIRRQDIHPAYYRNGSIYLVSTKTAIEQRTMMAKPMLPYVMPFDWLLNIDEPRDILIAEALIPAWKKGILG